MTYLGQEDPNRLNYWSQLNTQKRLILVGLVAKHRRITSPTSRKDRGEAYSPLFRGLTIR